MAIYVTGDTHGSQSYGAGSVDGFMHRFNTTSFPEQKTLGKNDYVIICGDFGGIWDTNRFHVEESKAEKNGLDWLEQKPFTTLFVPGNHENYDRLTGCCDDKLLNSWFYSKMPSEEKEKLKQGYPRIKWHGGYVRMIRPSVLMLERGEIFDIDGKYCFAFGGAKSHDIQDGILNPADFADEESFSKIYKQCRYKMIRVNGVSWWKQEMPSKKEMDHGIDNLSVFMKDHDKIDFVFTHDGPASHKIYLGYQDIDKLNYYLESLCDIMKYDKWFYGHLHDNRSVFDNGFLLYNRIIQIN